MYSTNARKGTALRLINFAKLIIAKGLAQKVAGIYLVLSPRNLSLKNKIS